MKTLKELVTFTRDVIRWSLSGGVIYQLYLCCLAALMVLGVYAYFVQIKVGLAATNMSNIVSWGFYIANFTFLVGVAAAAVMIILPSYIFKDKDLHKVVIIGEVVAIGALIMCLMFVFVDLGAPWNAWHLIPIIGLFNWPTSLLTWDVLVLNGYLVLNLIVPALCFSIHFLGLWNPPGDGLPVSGTARQTVLEQSSDGTPVSGIRLCGRPGAHNDFTDRNSIYYHV